MKSLLIKDTTREEREEIVRRALYGDCGAECEFCSGCYRSVYSLMHKKAVTGGRNES